MGMNELWSAISVDLRLLLSGKCPWHSWFLVEVLTYSFSAKITVGWRSADWWLSLLTFVYFLLTFSFLLPLGCIFFQSLEKILLDNNFRNTIDPRLINFILFSLVIVQLFLRLSDKMVLVELINPRISSIFSQFRNNMRFECALLHFLLLLLQKILLDFQHLLIVVASSIQNTRLI